MNQFSTWNDQTLLILAFLVRLFLILYARIHDYIFKLNFTDVDYEVFTEAAHFAWKGLSPYSLSTYRYPPIIAWILIPNNLFSDFGKIIFSILDISVGWIQLKYINEIYTRDKYRKINQRHLICFLWLFNPFNAIIATRGNSDSLICFLNIWTMFELFKGNFFLSAILHGGLATHLRLFPIIYLPSIFIYLSDYNNKCGKGLRSFIFYFLHNKRGFLFIFTSICSFLCSTLFCYRIYGQEFINSSLLYHLTRIDVSHNFSPYFFPLYLAMNNQVLTKFIGIFAFLPQIICNVLFAIRFSNDLPFCWFLTTFAFVSFNKVSTSQYFIWYLCFLPLIFHNIKFNLRKAFSLLALWLIAQGFWLLNAYLFEFCGYNTLPGIWVASLLFLITNCYIMIQFINDYLLFKHNKLQEKSE